MVLKEKQHVKINNDHIIKRMQASA